MPLIVEDGTMPEGANTYASVADADAYLLSRGVSGWAAPPSSDLEPDPQLSAKEAALIRSADYLNGLKWKGEKIEYDWPMAWPRAGVPTGVKNIHGVMQFVACDTVPSAVKRACIELAALFIAGKTRLHPSNAVAVWRPKPLGLSLPAILTMPLAKPCILPFPALYGHF